MTTGKPDEPALSGVLVPGFGESVGDGRYREILVDQRRVSSPREHTGRQRKGKTRTGIAPVDVSTMDIDLPPRPQRASRAVSVFVSAVLRNPGAVGAVAPSSAELGAVLASVVPTSGTPTVVELGAGTGAVTTQVAQRLPARGQHLAVEIDPVLAAHLRHTHPGVTVIDGDAAELSALLTAEGVRRVDAVVSGLPWSLFDEAGQRRILTQVAQALAPHGAFSTFAYRHAALLSGAVRFRALLHEVFDEVVVSRTVWRNLPPAHVYVCRRPRDLGAA